MKKNFDKCLEMLLHHEGGFTADKRDKGNAGDGHGNQGSTMLGVTSKVWADWTGKPAPIEVMRALKAEDVAPLYKKKYWERLKCPDVRINSGLAWVLLDFGVNSGTGRAARCLQKIVGAVQDGAIGNKTLDLVEKQDPKYLIEQMYKVRQEFYESLRDFEHFGRGWTRRNDETKRQALDLVQ